MSLTEAFEQLQNDTLVSFAVPVFLLATWVEYWIVQKEQLNLYHKKDFWVSIAMGLITSIVELLPKVPPQYFD